MVTIVPSSSGPAGPADPRSPMSVTVPTTSSADAEVELVADRLFAAGASAVSAESDAHGATVLVADPLVSELDSLLVALAHLDVRALERDDAWRSEWRSHATVRRCGERLVIRPAWLEPVDLAPDEVEVVVDPGDAFGSGAHATTRLCLAALEGLVRPGDRVLDVGCGSGILAVAAALLGAASVTAVDIDAEAVRATADTAQRNGVADRVQVGDTPVGELRSESGEDLDAEFDLVLANLLIPIVEQLGPALVARTGSAGVLVVSGILVGQRDRALRACKPLEPRGELREDDWCALVLARPSAAPSAPRR